MATPGMMKTFLILLFLVCSFSCTNGYQDKAVVNPQFKVRKLASLHDVILDYHEATPNPAHDPGKGRPAGKSANNP